MSLQVFLQAQLRGSERFLGHIESSGDEYAELIGRCGWLSLISEVLPRALLSQMKLSRMLLGSSGGEQFLLVLTDESLPEANEFLKSAAAAIAELSSNTLELYWASTENLGAWPIVRKRLEEALERETAAPLRSASPDSAVFQAFEIASGASASDYFISFGRALPTARSVSWSPDHPAHLATGGSAYSWPLRDQSVPEEDGIAFPLRYAADDGGQCPASLVAVASRSQGAARWGILRGDVDLFDSRLRRTNSVEERLLLSVLFKEFFTGELSLLCALPEFWRKVSVLYRGGDDFAVIGCWDALVALARELQRLFEKFVAQNLQSFAGLEGKSISMAMAVADSSDSSPFAVFDQAGTFLRAAKATEIGTFHLFGRTLEWKRLPDAEDLKNGLVRMVKDFGYPPEYLNDLAAVYREAYSAQATKRNKAIRLDKPWLTYMRLSRIIPPAKQRDLNQLRSALFTQLLGTKTANAKLRPSGRVGLEWARLASEV